MIHLPFGGAVISSERPNANEPKRLVGRSIDILSCMPVTDKVKSSTICECGIYISSFIVLTMGIFALVASSALDRALHSTEKTESNQRP
jgi:hypothetical protein